MGIRISNLINFMGNVDEINIMGEREFDFFARTSSIVPGKKCIFLTNKKYIREIDETVAMIITNSELSEYIDDNKYGIVITNEPRGLYFELLSYYEKTAGVNKVPTVIGTNCNISKTAVIPAYDVIIGDNVAIGDYTVLYPNTEIKNNVSIQSMCKVGEQDLNTYEYKGVTKRVYHSGKVIIGSNVSISAGTFVGQALYRYGRTIVGDNCVVGANVGIGHNSIIGNNVEICGNAFIGGFCNIGKRTTLYMSTTIANNITIGEATTVNVGSVVVRNVESGKTVFGNPARVIN